MKLFDDNGVETPHIAELAAHGVKFTRAFSNAPVCSVARSTLITGCYGPRTGAQFHRKIKPVPLPEGVRMFPAYLREAGYYTSNSHKEDYNYLKDAGAWDESSKEATYRNREGRQPFFHVQNWTITHESSLHFSKEDMYANETITDLNSFDVQPNHPQTDLFRYTNARYRDSIQKMDKEIGLFVQQLEDDGLLDQTFIFYFGDHGGVLPGSKGYVYETGLHVPLVVYIPDAYKDLVDFERGTSNSGFVSFVDFGPTVLNLAGIEIPEGVDGTPFLGGEVRSADVSSRDETFSYADRFDEKYDLVRAVRKGKYKYIRSYQPRNFDGLRNNYRYKQLAYAEWADLYERGALNEDQSFFFKDLAPELLFDVESDPFEMRNLAGDLSRDSVLKEMRMTLDSWLLTMPDLSFFPEHFLIEEAFDNPVLFGKKHKANIEKMIQIANLQLMDYGSVSEQLEKYLRSADPWERYWGLLVCSSFGPAAKERVTIISDMASSDSEMINRTLAAEYLGIENLSDPAPLILNALYSTDSPAEALMILNSIVMLKDGHHYRFKIVEEQMDPMVLENDEVQRRLEYLL